MSAAHLYSERPRRQRNRMQETGPANPAVADRRSLAQRPSELCSLLSCDYSSCDGPCGSARFCPSLWLSRASARKRAFPVRKLKSGCTLTDRRRVHPISYRTCRRDLVLPIEREKLRTSLEFSEHFPMLTSPWLRVVSATSDQVTLALPRVEDLGRWNSAMLGTCFEDFITRLDEAIEAGGVSTHQSVLIFVKSWCGETHPALRSDRPHRRNRNSFELSTAQATSSRPRLGLSEFLICLSAAASSSAEGLRFKADQ